MWIKIALEKKKAEIKEIIEFELPKEAGKRTLISIEKKKRV